MQAVLQVQLTVPADDVREQVAVEGRVRVEDFVVIAGTRDSDAVFLAYYRL